MNKELLISVIYPVYECHDTELSYIDKIHDFLTEHFNDFEIIITTSAMNSNTQLEKKLDVLDSLRIIYLTEANSLQVSYAAGLSSAIGDYVILTDCSVKVEAIYDGLSEAYQNGFDLISGVSTEKKPILYRFMRLLFFFIFKSLLPTLPPKNSSNLRILSRNITQILIQKNINPHQLYVFLAQTHLPQKHMNHNSYPYNQNNIFQGARQAMNLVTYGSTKLLKFVSFLGISGSLLGVIISCYAILIHLFKSNKVEGWTSLTLFTSAQFFLIFIILFVFGEYLARSIEQKSNVINSNVLYEKISKKTKAYNRYNIHKE